MDEFDIYLESAGSMNIYSGNTMAAFRNLLAHPIHLEGDWRVALAEIIFPTSGRPKFWTIQQLQQKVNNLRYYNEFPKKGAREGKNVSRSESPRDTRRYPEKGTSLNHYAQSQSN